MTKLGLNVAIRHLRKGIDYLLEGWVNKHVSNRWNRHDIHSKSSQSSFANIVRHTKSACQRLSRISREYTGVRCLDLAAILEAEYDFTACYQPKAAQYYV